MSHPIETFTAEAIAACRTAEKEISVENNVHLSPEIYINWDEDEGNVALTAHFQANMLLALEAKVTKSPRWFSLNIGLGRGALAPGDVLGLVFEVEIDKPFHRAPFCRSAVDDAYGDTYWQDSLNVAGEGKQIVTLLRSIEPGDPLTKDGFHTLVIPLPPADFSLTLYDMRLFVVDAARGLRVTPMSAASLG